MIFTQKTINVLKNFYTINSSLCFSPGNVLRTVSPTKTILAEAKVDMEFPSEFCIYDLMRFMNSLALFLEPELEVNEKTVVISDKTSRIEYRCAAKNLIALPPEKNLQLPKDVPCHFMLTNTDMTKLTRAMATLGLPEVAVVGENNNLMIQGIDSDGKIQDNYSLTIGTTKNTFKVIFKTENLKLLPDDYEIKAAKIGEQKIPVAHFVGKNEDIQYWIAVGKDSTL